MKYSKVLVKLLNARRKREYFYTANSDRVKRGDLWLVDRGYGEELGVILTNPVIEDSKDLGSPSHKIIRKGGPRDKERMAQVSKEAHGALEKANQLTEKYNLSMDLVAAEFTLDKNTLFIYFISPEWVDYRDMEKELAFLFDSRIELRHIGPREEAQIKGGLGRCGNPLCCARFLTSPKSISISLVHDQELFVSPERVTGLCGRLFCCLDYEHKEYVQIISKMPRIGAQVRYRGTEYEVVAHNIFKKAVILEEKDGSRKEVPYRDIKG